MSVALKQWASISKIKPSASQGIWNRCVSEDRSDLCNANVRCGKVRQVDIPAQAFEMYEGVYVVPFHLPCRSLLPLTCCSV